MGNVKPLISEATETNAEAIQQFLQINQDNSIVVDYKFGKKIVSRSKFFRSTRKERFGYGLPK